MSYRSDVPTAVSIFRPILAELHIRTPEKQNPVFLAEFNHPFPMALDACSVQILHADLGECSGMFISSYTKTGLLRTYIVLNEALYQDDSLSGREKLKITGVHEFCHFIAIIFAAVAMSIDELKQRILERLNKKIDRLQRETLSQLYVLLSNKTDNSAQPPFEELTDTHFRLDIEAATVDYNVLFHHFLFSKDLFESVFTKEKQHTFKKLLITSPDRAAMLLLEALREVTQNKWIPYQLALR